jgi:hypothetical protein
MEYSLSSLERRNAEEAEIRTSRKLARYVYAVKQN